MTQTTTDRPADLVLEGGGVKGIALAAAAIRLTEAGYRFQRVAGTSAGAIVAALVAALVKAGRPVSQLTEVMKTVDYPQFMRTTGLRRRLGRVGDAERLLLHDGVYDGEYLVEWLGGVLNDIGVTTFGQLALDDPDADRSWTADQRFSLVVHASDITRRRLVRLPWDYRQYGLDPAEQKITDAVRASMSIPFFFEPVRFRAAAGAEFDAGAVTWVDGGLLDNYPVDVFDRGDDVAARWPTIGIKLSARPAHITPKGDCHDLVTEAVACLRTALDNADRVYVDDAKAARTIFVDTTGVSSTDFRLTADEQQQLYANGRAASEQWLTSAAVPATV